MDSMVKMKVVEDNESKQEELNRREKELNALKEKETELKEKEGESASAMERNNEVEDTTNG